MPSGRSVVLKPLVRVYNQLVAKRKLQKEYGLPLVEFGIELKNRSGEKRELFGLVPEGVDRDKAVKLVVEQNNGFCDVERGGYDPVNKIDLSEFTWIKQIALSDGFKVEDWLQIRDRHGEFEIGSADGKSFWENANTKKVNRYDNRIKITEDYGMAAELPDTNKLINGEEKACGGCGGAIGEDALELAKGIASMKIERDAEYSINLDTGKIREKTPLGFMEFDYKPEEIPLQEITLPNFNLARNEQQNTMDAGIFTDNKQLRLHEFAELDTVYVSAKALRDEESVEITPTPVVTGNNEIAVTQENQNKAGFRQEESMIIRLLMNPVERKLWGKIYGLPDDEEIRKSNEIKKKENNAPAKIKTKQAVPESVGIKSLKKLVYKKEKEEPKQTIKPEAKKAMVVKQTLNYAAEPVRIEESKPQKIQAIRFRETKIEKKQDAAVIIKPEIRKKKKRKRKFIVKDIREKKTAPPKQKTVKKQIGNRKKIIDNKKEIKKDKTEKKNIKEERKKEPKPEVPKRKPKKEKKKTAKDKAHASFSKKKKAPAKKVKKGRNIVNYLLTEDIRHLFCKQPRKEVQQECN